MHHKCIPVKFFKILLDGLRYSRFALHDRTIRIVFLYSPCQCDGDDFFVRYLFIPVQVRLCDNNGCEISLLTPIQLKKYIQVLHNKGVLLCDTY
jgi:hypothetical protein